MGDKGLEACGIHTIVANELVESRANLMQKNFPNTHVIIGDIWEKKNEIIISARNQLQGEQLFCMIISAPCQGASSNGMGRISSEIRKGKRIKDDPRNRLMIPALEVVNELKPICVIVENVPGMRFTQIKNEHDTYESILSLMFRSLPSYILRSSVLNTADYGVPQTRKRLITLAIDAQHTLEPRILNYFTEESSVFHPHKTHTTHITLGDCIAHLPALDAKTRLVDDQDIFHRIPSWNDMQYFCMQHTPEDNTAFHNNRCIECKYTTENSLSIFCEKCNALLPKPVIKKNESLRLIRAFKTAYRRMAMNRPANALTTNSGVISSDVKGHPLENRVMSLREIMIIGSICGYNDVELPWSYDFSNVHDKIIREVIGECIPPMFAYAIGLHLINIIHESS